MINVAKEFKGNVPLHLKSKLNNVIWLFCMLNNIFQPENRVLQASQSHSIRIHENDFLHLSNLKLIYVYAHILYTRG